MKFFIFILILATFLQASFLPINLVLLIVIARSLVVNDKSDLLLAFFAGILLGILTAENIGFYTIIFISIVEVLKFIRRFVLSANILIVAPISFVFLLIIAFLEKLFLHQTINFSLVLIQALIALPVYLSVKFWEERFVVAPPLKLKYEKK